MRSAIRPRTPCRRSSPASSGAATSGASAILVVEARSAVEAGQRLFGERTTAAIESLCEVSVVDHLVVGIEYRTTNYLPQVGRAEPFGSACKRVDVGIMSNSAIAQGLKSRSTSGGKPMLGATAAIF